MKKILSVTIVLLMLLALFTGCAVNGSPQAAGSSPDAKPSETVSASTDESVSGTPDLPEPSAAQSEEPAPVTGIAQIESENYEYKSDYIDVRFEVPKLTGLSDSTVQDSINAVFAGIMDEAKNGVKASEAESKLLTEQTGTAASYMTYISYSVPYNKDGILDILVSSYDYRGGAHGGETRDSYTFDLRTGRRLVLGDLMTEDSGYKDVINTAIRKEIDKRVSRDELIENVPFQDIGDKPDFYLTADAIVIYFQEYAYFPYAAGIQEFPIKYSDLPGMMKKEYAALTITPVILDNTTGNTLKVGDIGVVALQGNTTTGYTWHYTISDPGVIGVSAEQYKTDASEGVVGAGGTYRFDFRALKPGTATIRFSYYRDWLGESDAVPENDIEYTLTIK